MGHSTANTTLSFYAHPVHGVGREAINGVSRPAAILSGGTSHRLCAAVSGFPKESSPECQCREPAGARATIRLSGRWGRSVSFSHAELNAR